MTNAIYVFAGYKYYPQRPSGDFQGKYSLTDLLVDSELLNTLKGGYDWYEMWEVDEEGLKLKFYWTKEV